VISASAALLLTNVASADFKDVVANRFSSNAENLIINVPPRPGTWPGAIFTYNMRFPSKKGDANDPALRRGDKIAIEAKDGLRLDASSKAIVWSFFRVSAEAADSADVVMSFPDAQLVEMNAADLVQRVATGSAASAAKRGQIPLIISRAYLGTPLVTISRKPDASPGAWAKAKAGFEAGAQAAASVQDSVSYTAGDPFIFAFEVDQIAFDPGELSKGSLKVNLAHLPSSLFALREQESDRALSAAESAISAITGLSAHEIEQKWIFLDTAKPSAAAPEAPARSSPPPPAAAAAPASAALVPAPLPRPAAAHVPAVQKASTQKLKTPPRRVKPKQTRTKPKKHRAAR
jgi:hypothetical protein